MHLVRPLAPSQRVLLSNSSQESKIPTDSSANWLPPPSCGMRSDGAGPALKAFPFAFIRVHSRFVRSEAGRPAVNDDLRCLLGLCQWHPFRVRRNPTLPGGIASLNPRLLSGIPPGCTTCWAAPNRSLCAYHAGMNDAAKLKPKSTKFIPVRSTTRYQSQILGVRK